MHDRALEQAIRRDQIELRFQPQIEPASGRIVGVEALARESIECLLACEAQLADG